MTPGIFKPLVTAALSIGVWIIASTLVADIAAADVVLVSNLAEPLNPGGPTVIGNTPGGSDDQVWAAQAFATDANPWMLLTVQANMGSALSNTMPMFFELRKDTGTNQIDMSASGLITDFGFPSDMTGANTIQTFSLLDAVPLAANTKYWFMAAVDPSSTETFEWEYAHTGNFTGPGSLAEYGFSIDQGATWSYPVNPYFPWTLQVNVMAVPEPGSCCGMAALGMLACLRWRRRAQP